MYSFCYGDKENSPIFIGVQEIKNGQIQKFFRGIAYAGYCIVFLFAVYTFEKSIPDQIYVKAGEAIDYQFQVPVTMEIQEDSSPVAKSTNNANVRQSYIVTCRLFGIFR